VTAIDAFADRDQHPAVTAHAVPPEPGRPFTARALADASCRVAGDAVVYLSPLENHPSAVRRIARGRQLWGNDPGVLRRVRDPRGLAAALRDAGLRAPQVAEGPHEWGVGDAWVQKPRLSGGGRGVRAWMPGMDLTPGTLLQERIEGRPCSVVFVAAGGCAVPFALSHQLVGDPAFGASRFQYCGSILPPDDDPVLGRTSGIAIGAARLAEVVTVAFGLVGMNGIDFIASAEGPVAIEVNPRWCASMELVDRTSHVPVLEWHVNACRAASLSGVQGDREGRLEALGKAVVFARAAVTVGDTDAWLADRTVGDVPRAGTAIGAASVDTQIRPLMDT
jgi:uncharacterized protein